MRLGYGVRRDVRRDACRTALTAVLALMLLAAIATHAQTLPKQSTRRDNSGAGRDGQGVPKGGHFEPRLEVGVRYANNINLATNSQRRINAAGFEVSPGVYASLTTETITAAIDYSLISRRWDNSDFSDISHRLLANGRWNALRDLFYVVANAAYDDGVVDPSAGLNYGNLGIFGQSNLTERVTTSISPKMHVRFNGFELDGSYSYGRVSYLDFGNKAAAPVLTLNTIDDSVDRDAYLSFGNSDDGQRLSGSGFYESQRTDYARSSPYRYERVGIEGGFRVVRALSLVGSVGRESTLDESVTRGGLDSDYWGIGLRWERDNDTSAEVRFGHRFFGESYSASMTREARFLRFDASYTESPQLATRQLRLGRIDPGTLPPSFAPAADVASIEASPYISKEARLGIAAKGSRTTLRLDGYYNKRDYFRKSLGDEQGAQVRFTATRRLASNVSVDVSGAYSDYQRTTLGVALTQDTTNAYDTEVVLRGNRTLGPRLSASLEAGLLSRSGTTPYDGWWVSLRGRWSAVAR